jgi:hypothetical protein
VYELCTFTLVLVRAGTSLHWDPDMCNSFGEGGENNYGKNGAVWFVVDWTLIHFIRVRIQI